MSLTSGFYNSLDGDRTYNAEQMSELFDGIINDGIFESVGTCFAVTANSGNTVNIGIGRAWFNSTWVKNDAIYPLTLSDAELLLNRIDAVVIEVDRSSSVRAASLKEVTGTAASNPSNPTLTNDSYVHQYPLAYIYRTAGSEAITQSNITSMIGTSSVPFVTGVLDVLDITELLTQWQDQFDKWFENMKDQLDEDAAGNLQNQIDTLSGIGYVETTLYYADWSGSSAPYTQSVDVLDMTSAWIPGNPVLVSTGDSSTDLAAQEAFACVSTITSSAGTLTFTCYEDKPEADFTIRIPGLVSI